MGFIIVEFNGIVVINGNVILSFFNVFNISIVDVMINFDGSVSGNNVFGIGNNVINNGNVDGVVGGIGGIGNGGVVNGGMVSNGGNGGNGG